MAGQQEGFFSVLAPFMGRPLGAFSGLPSSSQRAHAKQDRVFNATEFRRIRRFRASLHPLVVCTGVLVLACGFLPFAACVAGRHANALRSSAKLSPSLSAPARFPPFPLSPASVSDLQANDGVSAAPPLGLEEDKDCFFDREVPPNITGDRKEIRVHMDNWAEHVENRSVERGNLSAYQTTHRPGYERQFGLSFPIPRNLASKGKATLRLARKWEGHEHNWECPEHILEVFELADDGYLQGRRGVKETGVRFDWTLEEHLRVFEVDVTDLVYGRNMAGHHLHLLFREKIYECLSQFDNENDEEPPSLALVVNGDDAVDAKYGNWDRRGSCRVDCKSRQNFRCEVRDCTPGENGGEPCVKELMIQKVPCTDEEADRPCTCEDLQGKCARGSDCDASAEDGAQCTCNGRFVRESVDEPTVCVPSE